MNKKGITVVSLFDGISCAQAALKKNRVPVRAYYASEIDKPAMEITLKNFPNTKFIGDVTKVKGNKFGKVDLLIGGSPCQDLSIAKKDRKGLKGSRSSLFWHYVRILKSMKPKYFVLENVASMPKEDKAIITKTLGVEPIMIDAALVSAQRRKRLFWTNIKGIKQPRDQGIFLKDILEDGVIPKKEKSNTIRTGGRGSELGNKHNWDEIEIFQYRRTYWRKTVGGKVPTLTANMGTGGNNVPYVCRASVQKNAEQYNDKSPVLTAAMGVGGGNVPLLLNNKDAKKLKGKYIDSDERKNKRKLTTIECERLQSLPDNYTEGISNTQRYKTLGNAFNRDVVAHILKSAKW